MAIANPASLTAVFPSIPEPEISRDALVQHIAAQFSDRVQQQILVGGPLSGKTTLLSQFARAFPGQCVCYFLTPNPFTQDQRAFLFSLVCQICEINGDAPPAPTTELTILKSLLHPLCQALARRARSAGRPYYILVDGIEWGMVGTSGNRVIDVFPPPTFPTGPYLLFTCRSGREYDLPEHLRPPQIPEIPASLWTFNRADTREYFGDLSIPVDKVDEIHSKYQGTPGYLRVIRESVTRDASFDPSGAPSELGQLLRRHVKVAMEGMVPEAQEGLFLLAAAPLPLRPDSLGRIVGVDIESLLRAVSACGLLKPAAVDTRLEFCNELIQSAVAAADAVPPTERLDALFRHYEGNEPDEELLMDLLLIRRRDYGGLVRRLDTESILDTARDFRSGVPAVMRRLHSAAELARDTGEVGGLLRWCLASTAVRSFVTHAVNRSDIDALISVGDTSEALRRASTLGEVTSRISAVAKVFAAMKARRIGFPEDAREALASLVTSVNVEALDRDLARDLALDLYPVLPDVAVGVLDRISTADRQESVIDKAIDALRSKYDPGQEDPGERSSDQNILAHAARPAVGAWLSDLPVEALQEDLASTRSTDAKEYLVRTWCRQNKEAERLPRGVDLWLDTILSDPGFSVPLRSLRQIVEVIQDEPIESRRRLVKRLRIPRLMSIDSPREEWIRVALGLADASADYDPEDAFSAVRSSYLVVKDRVVEDDERLFCLARVLLSAVTTLRGDPSFAAEVRKEFSSRLTPLLEHSADHLEVLRGTLSVLTRVNPDEALLAAACLNTRMRRSRAAELILAEALRWHGGRDLSKTLNDGISLIAEERRDAYLARLLPWLISTRSAVTPANLSVLECFAQEVSSPTLRSRTLVALAAMCRGCATSHVDNLLQDALRAWECESDLSVRLQWGYDLVVEVAELDEDRARALLQEVEQLTSQPSSCLAAGSLGRLHEALIDSACRLIDLSSASKDETILRIEHAISRVSSVVSRIRLYAILAASTYREGYTPRFGDLVQRSILPTIASVTDLPKREGAVYYALPVVYQYDADEAVRLTKSIAPGHADDAWYGAILWALCCSHLGDHLGDPDDFRCSRDYPSLKRAVAALRHIHTDAALIAAIQAITRVVTSSLKGQLSPSQALDLLNQVQETSDDKLPDKENIGHEGYRVLANTYVHAARGAVQKALSRSRTQGVRGLTRELITQGWRKLDESARAIPNTADRVLVMSLLAREMRAYYDRDRSSPARTIIRDAADIVDMIPTLHDRMTRLSGVADTLHAIGDDEEARFIIEKAAEVAKHLRGLSADRRLEEAVEVAYKVDKDLADQIVVRHDPNRVPGTLPSSAEHALRVRELVANPARLDRVPGPVEFRASVMEASALRMLGEMASATRMLRDLPTLMAWLMEAQSSCSDSSMAVCSWVCESLASRWSQQAREGMIEDILDLADLTVHLAELATQRECTASMARDSEGARVFGIASRTFLAGQEAVARKWLHGWISDNAEQYLTICDPYFGYDELTYLQAVPSECRVIVVTTDTYLALDRGTDTLRTEIRLRWEEAALGADPPNATFFIIPAKMEMQFHDRVIVTSSLGLGLGQSLNGLGKKHGNVYILDKAQKEGIERNYINPMLEYSTWFVHHNVRPAIIELGP